MSDADRYRVVSADTDATVAADAPAEAFDFEAVFRTHYRRIARVIVRVIQDRREKYERWLGIDRAADDPERSHEAAEARTKIRAVLATLRSHDAQLIAVRAEGFSYEEMADTLNLNPASIGTMRRAATVTVGRRPRSSRSDSGIT